MGVISLCAQNAYEEAVRTARQGDTLQALQLLDAALSLPAIALRARVYKGKLLLGQKKYSELRQVGWELLSEASLLEQKWGLYFLGSVYAAEGRDDSLSFLWRRYVLPSPKSTLHDLPKVVSGESKIVISDTALLPVPVPFFPKNLGPQVNSKYDEYDPTLTGDGRVLYFTRHGPRRTNPNKLTEDTYWCERESKGSPWKAAQRLGEPLNTDEYNEAIAEISADGQAGVYMICAHPAGLGSCDLYFSELQGRTWTQPVNLTALNSPSWEPDASLTADRRRIYFISNREGGIGGSDIWYSDWKDGKWGPPVNLGPPVNSPGNEHYPFIAADGRTLYFASDGHPGLGGLDLFVSFLTDTGWTVPRNLGYPLNSPEHEMGIVIDAHGDEAYIALKNRSDGLGGADIYYFRLWPELRPERSASYVRGRVMDAQSQGPVAAQVYVLDPQTRDTLRAITANFATGEFLLSLPLGQRYLFFAEAKGYLPHSEFFDLSQKDTAYVIEIALRKVEKGASMTLRNVFFDFDKATLRPESEVELRKVAEILRQNPGWRIEVQGHTDSLGNPAYNQNLSQRRAEAVRQFLIGQGIAAPRITVRGYGATRPIAPNATEDGRARNRRVEVVFLSKE